MKKEEVLNALTQIASKFRSRVGESLSTIQQHDTPLAEATTASLEALEAYSLAWKVHSSSGAAAALPLFRRATEIDPNFAMAHAALGRMYADLDESDLSAESATRVGNCRIARVIGRSSLSLLATRRLLREIWKRRNRPARHGHKPTLVMRCPIHSCRVYQQGCRAIRKGGRRSPESHRSRPGFCLRVF